MTEKTTQVDGRPQSAIWTVWEEAARDALVQEMKQRKIGYKELSRRLDAMGIFESPDRLNRKVNRKRFSAAFMLACFQAMGTAALPICTN
ncbi:hypothetical protein D3870_09945 [Noviherbaspirillum cavernae]|uniref:DUF6471 domain-containing protein n=1 Tax=Noviherbaspirillum cavernae TaxID=2320862 RepID=A0A418X1G1_9BURK|nr:DUF6471 domain-containing protein [Noviherbaspirillum cavernae]RJG06287.1 hypothetical protein D3870_09945 [Noviherbaspirillum cavernae]